jgi:3-oxoacyl-[acyl-carrier-protein] synthase-3
VTAPTPGHAGISGIAYALPARRRSVRELHALGQLESDPALLEQFGFSHVYVAEEETPYALALAAARALLDDCAFAPAGSAAAATSHIASTRRFQYPATRMQYDLDLECASTFALDQLACTSLFSAVRVARALVATGDARRVLCVSSEFFPADAGREAIYNCTADAACAVLVDHDAPRNRILASAHTTKGYYWQGDAMRNEIVASYFPTAKHVIAETLARASWRPDDVTWVMPHNISIRSWEILLGLTGIPRERLWSGNIARIGHTLAGDNFINLRDAVSDGSVRPGDRLLLFSYGYGAHWTALALEA